MARCVFDVFREHAASPIGELPALKRVLRSLVQFNETVALAERAAFPAVLSAVATRQPQSRPSSFAALDWDKQPPRAAAAPRSVSVPLRLWIATTPWETQRGLSHAPPTSLATARGDGSDTPHDDCAERGMLFVQNPASDAAEGDSGEDAAASSPLPASTSAARPTCFWSGGITAPIDVAFLYRDEPRPAALPLEPQDEPLIVGDWGHLSPFPAFDAARGGSALEECPERAAPCHEVASRFAGVHSVLEARRFLFRDLVRRAVADARDEVLVTLQPSPELLAELGRRARLHEMFVAPLAAQVRFRLAECNAPRGFRVASRSDAAGEDEGMRARAFASAREKSEEGTTDPSEGLPRRRAPSFVGRNPAVPGAASARAHSGVRAGDPGLPELPPLDAELLALAFRLGLCSGAIARCMPRLLHELARAESSPLQSDASVALLLNLTEDAALQLPSEELAGAVRQRAAERGLARARLF